MITVLNVNQSHAPFPTRCPQIRAYYKRAIECTAEAGGEICIIHPDNHKSAEENGEMYLELLPFAKALKEIEYKGYYTLEADRFLVNYTDGLRINGNNLNCFELNDNRIMREDIL